MAMWCKLGCGVIFKNRVDMANHYMQYGLLEEIFPVFNSCRNRHKFLITSGTPKVLAKLLGVEQAKHEGIKIRSGKNTGYAWDIRWFDDDTYELAKSLQRLGFRPKEISARVRLFWGCKTNA